MMLVWVLVLTALLASDVAGGTTDSLGPEETRLDREKRDIVRGPCDENWFYFGPLNSCYRFFPDAKPWSDAEEVCKCQSYSGHLAAVCSIGHNTFISDVIDVVNKDKPETWIGLNERSQEGNFIWADGSSYGYKNWANGEPNNYGGDEDCVTVNHLVDGKWNDDSCDKSFPFVCYYKLCD